MKPRLVARLALGSAGIVVALGLFATPQAVASTTIGDDFASGGCTGSGTPFTRLRAQTSSPGNLYEAPFDGVITSWTGTNGMWDHAALRVVRLGSGTSFSVVGADAQRLDDAINLVRIPVRQRDVIGLYYDGTLGCKGSNVGGGYATRDSLADVSPGSSGSFDPGNDFPGYKISVAAQLERDADGDGYGDETQDLCPSDVSTQGLCPVPDMLAPDTEITKGPKKKSKSKMATFVFSATEPGSTFECSLDGAEFTGCSSPHGVKVKPGKHNFQVRAVDAAGNDDPSEATYSWKVVKKKKRKKH
jgi:hypothetical protein